MIWFLVEHVVRRSASTRASDPMVGQALVS